MFFHVCCRFSKHSILIKKFSFESVLCNLAMCLFVYVFVCFVCHIFVSDVDFMSYIRNLGGQIIIELFNA